MARVQDGGSTAFAELYDRHVACALRIANWKCSSPGQAEDAVQEAFLSAWRHRATYRSEAGSCRSWLMAIVRNSAIDQTRRNRGYHQVAFKDDNAIADEASSAHDHLVSSAESVALRASVKQLPRAQGEVIHLAYFVGLSHVEIAARLALPLGTVKGRMRLGLMKLRAEVQALEGASQRGD